MEVAQKYSSTLNLMFWSSSVMLFFISLQYKSQ